MHACGSTPGGSATAAASSSSPHAKRPTAPANNPAAATVVKARFIPRLFHERQTVAMGVAATNRPWRTRPAEDQAMSNSSSCLASRLRARLDADRTAPRLRKRVSAATVATSGSNAAPPGSGSMFNARITAHLAYALAILACSATEEPSPSHANASSGSGGQGGSGGIGFGGEAPGWCSPDLHSAIDAKGKITECPPDQGCFEGECLPACEAAAK